MRRTTETSGQTSVYMNARVCDIQDTTPRLRRISLKHEVLKEIGSLAPGAHFKVLIPAMKGQQTTLPDLSSGRPHWPDPQNKPIIRTYTVRNLDSERGILNVEFVLHGDIGPASAWAAQALINDYLGIGIKKSGKTIEWADWYLFAGDETAIPAIATILEALPAESSGIALLEVDGPSDIFPINTKSSVEVRWLTRDGILPQHSDKLLIAIKDVVISNTIRYLRYVWMAGEHNMIKALRKYATEQLGLDRDQLHATAYWTAGLSEEEKLR